MGLMGLMGNMGEEEFLVALQGRTRPLIGHEAPVVQRLGVNRLLAANLLRQVVALVAVTLVQDAATQ